MAKSKPPVAGARKSAAKRNPTPGTTGAAARGTAPPGTTAVLPGTVTRIVQEHAAGAGKRKNMFVPQGLLDQAREVLGVKTETEAVALGLGAAVDLAAFQREMLAGFDQLMTTGGLSPVDDAAVVLDGFRTRPAR